MACHRGGVHACYELLAAMIPWTSVASCGSDPARVELPRQQANAASACNQYSRRTMIGEATDGKDEVRVHL